MRKETICADLSVGDEKKVLTIGPFKVFLRCFYHQNNFGEWNELRVVFKLKDKKQDLLVFGKNLERRIIGGLLVSGDILEAKNKTALEIEIYRLASGAAGAYGYTTEEYEAVGTIGMSYDDQYLVSVEALAQADPPGVGTSCRFFGTFSCSFQPQNSELMRWFTI